MTYVRETGLRGRSKGGCDPGTRTETEADEEREVLEMGIIAWIIIGGVAGWLASLVTGTNARFGIIGNIVIGVVGALIGGFLLGLLGFSEDPFRFSGWTLLVAFAGAVVLLLIYRAIVGRGSYSRY